MKYGLYKITDGTENKGLPWQLECIEQNQGIREFPTAAKAKAWAKNKGHTVKRWTNCDR